MIRPPTLVTSLQLTSGMSMGLFLSFVSTSAKNKICRVCMPWFTSSLCILLHVVTSCMSRTLVPASLVCTGWLYIYSETVARCYLLHVQDVGASKSVSVSMTLMLHKSAFTPPLSKLHTPSPDTPPPYSSTNLLRRRTFGAVDYEDIGGSTCGASSHRTQANSPQVCA